MPSSASTNSARSTKRCSRTVVSSPRRTSTRSRRRARPTTRSGAPGSCRRAISTTTRRTNGSTTATTRAAGSCASISRGRFIYRLAGRDRQKSASYYTPESLTRCVVKYALRELIPDDMPADRILDLTVCEPAMGSAAFLNEAVNQLAEKYLERKQRERGKRIPHADYADELQQVKHYIADRNVYGVDLNPVARELAEVSLWLNCIHQSGHVPWFGYQLACGNSLVGARRQVFPSTTLGAENRKSELWFNHAPERVAPPAAVDATLRGGRNPARQRCVETDAPSRSATSRRHRLSLPAAGPRHGGLPRQGGEETGARAVRADQALAQAVSSRPFAEPSRSPSWKRSPTAWMRSGPCTPSSLPATIAKPRTPCPSGAGAPTTPAAPPTLGRTASARQGCSATTPATPAPTAA